MADPKTGAMRGGHASIFLPRLTARRGAFGCFDGFDAASSCDRGRRRKPPRFFEVPA
jgi:hypothetical protein